MGPPGWWEAKFDMKTSCREHLLHSAVTESLSVGLPRGCHVLPFKGMARLHMDTCHELRFRQTYGWPACRNWIPSRNQAASSHGSSTSPHDAPTDVVISDLGQLNKWIFFRSGETAKQLGPGSTTQAEAWPHPKHLGNSSFYESWVSLSTYSPETAGSPGSPQNHFKMKRNVFLNRISIFVFQPSVTPNHRWGRPTPPQHGWRGELSFFRVIYNVGSVFCRTCPHFFVAGFVKYSWVSWSSVHYNKSLHITCVLISALL